MNIILAFKIHIGLDSAKPPETKKKYSQIQAFLVSCLCIESIEKRMNDMSEKCFQLAPDLAICRIVNGMWQVAGGHGQIDRELAVEDMMRYHDAGFTSWDLADIYGPAEDFVGQFRRNLLELKRKRRTR